MDLSVFVERLQEYNNNEKFNISLLARKLGFSRITVSNVLNKKHNPSTKLLIAFVEHFDCSADYLLNKKDLPIEKEFKAVKPFGEILRRCLKESHKSEADLQRELNVSSSLTYRWLNNIAQPNVESLMEVAEYFNCSIDYLLGRE